MTDTRKRSRIPRYDENGNLIRRKVGRPRKGEPEAWEALPLIHHLLPEDERVMPAETRPDSEALTHKSTCMCNVCMRPGMQRKKNIEWRKSVGLKQRANGRHIRKVEPDS